MTSQQRPLSTLRYGCLALLAGPSTTSLPIGLLFRFSLMLDVQELRLNSMLSASDALERLREGNRRFASNTPATPALRFTRQDELRRQEPFAIVLGCSDARVPAEIIFDQGLGDLFVIRVAGNVVAPSGVGSVEFAAARFGTRLVVVLGHSGCGAVAATIEELQGVPQVHSQNLRSIVDRVRPSVESLLEVSRAWNPEELLHQAVRANIRVSANQLRHGSQLLEQLIQEDGLMVVGAEYSLENGLVDFLESPAGPSNPSLNTDASPAALARRPLGAG
jgi:carbonic anhydrase